MIRLPSEQVCPPGCVLAKLTSRFAVKWSDFPSSFTSDPPPHSSSPFGRQPAPADFSDTPFFPPLDDSLVMTPALFHCAHTRPSPSLRMTAPLDVDPLCPPRMVLLFPSTEAPALGPTNVFLDPWVLLPAPEPISTLLAPDTTCHPAPSPTMVFLSPSVSDMSVCCVHRTCTHRHKAVQMRPLCP